MLFDSLEDLRTFVLVVDAGSLSAAARALRVTTHAVSRRLMRLERQAGVRLLNRTTRRLSLTAEGRTLHARAVRALDELEVAEADLRVATRQLAGAVRVAIPPVLATRDFLARVRELSEANERLTIQLAIASVPVDLTAGGFDAAVHVGEPQDSALTMRRLGSVAWPLCAAPEYLARRGRPGTPDELRTHHCLRFLGARVQDEWPLVGADGQEVMVPVAGVFECDDSRVLGDAAYAGLGIGVRPPRELAAAHAAGLLEPVLPAYRMAGGPVYVLLPPSRVRLPRVTALLELLRAASAVVL